MSDPTPALVGQKLQRVAHLLYINADFTTTDTQEAPATWLLIGKDSEDLSIELNPDTEIVKNILDETSVKDNGYEPSISDVTYYANPDGSNSSAAGKFYAKIKDIAMNRKTGDDCRTLVLEVITDQTGTASFTAWEEEVVVKPQSYGGPQGGLTIPYNIYFDGNRTQGTATFTGLSTSAPDPYGAKKKTPTFSAS